MKKGFKSSICVRVVLFAVLMIGVLTFISGCGLGETTEKRLFEAMKKNGYLDLKCDYDDYDEVREVSQSPVPSNITYYDYKQNGKTYTIDYSSRILAENDSVYQVRVTIESGDESETNVYYFDKETFKARK